MKGIVFTEFLEMVETFYGEEMVDHLLDTTELASGGAYTAVGTYDHQEMVDLVQRLSDEVNAPVADLLHLYGRHLFGQFSINYSRLFLSLDDCFEFLKTINDHIHVEVRKLYPEAELPHILTRRIGENQLEVVYKSERPFADFAAGLIDGAIHHFGETITVERLASGAPANNQATFLLTRIHS